MANLGDATINLKINAEMTETSRAVLRNEVLKILSEPTVLQELLKLLVQESTRGEIPHDRRTEA
jgi:hypothetical protein